MGGTTCFSKFTRNNSIRTIDMLLRLGTVKILSQIDRGGLGPALL